MNAKQPDSVSRRKFLTAAGAAGVGLGVAAPAALGAEANDTAASSAMPRRPLGKTGWLTSIVGFGGGSRYQNQDDLAVAEKMIHRAIELGINYFDTAYMYQIKGVRESYRRYSKFLIPNYRKQILLVSKLAARDAETAKRNLDESLKELGTDYIDLLHFHDLRKKEDVDRIVSAEGALKVFRKAKEEKVIRAVGVTGHVSGDVMLDAIKRIEPDCVMCPQNPAHSGTYGGSDFAKVIPYALERGLGMTAMKTTAQGGLVGKNGVTAEQLVRYTLNLPIAAAIIGMPNLEVLESCAAIAKNLRPMAEGERLELEQKLASVEGELKYLASGYEGECGSLRIVI